LNKRHTHKCTIKNIYKTEAATVGVNIRRKMILGIDVSTSITGFALVGADEILHYSACDLRKHKGTFAKADAIKEYIEDIFEMYQLNNDSFIGESKFPIDKIYIEQPLMMFAKGRSSASVISTLTTFNGIVSWLVYEMFEIEPEYVSASSARKKAGVSVKRGQKAKEVVLAHLLEHEPAFNIEYTKHGNPVAGSYDKADAIIVAKAGYAIEQESKKNKPAAT
jgi:hypothetical protein